MTTKITNDNITGMDASKLTGSIADARIPSSAVTQHVTGYNDASIRADILKLALHQAVDGNRAAFSLEDSFIDAFEDSTGIATETNVDRNTTGEYVNTIVLGSATVWPYTNFADQDFTVSSGAFGDIAGYNSNGTTHIIAKNNDSNYLAWTGSPSGWTHSMMVDYKASYNWTGIKIGFTNQYGMIKTWRLEYSDNGSDWSIMDQTGSTSSNVSGYTVDDDNNVSIATDATGVITNVNNGGNFASHGAEITFGTPVTARHLKISVGSHVANSNGNSALDFFQPIYQPFTTNATGTLISDTQTASSSRSSCSGVIMYEDAAGTGTLGTDLKIYFTADNGANWTEVSSYGTPTTYSGTKKLVRLGSTNVTAGTQVAMKAVWANQAAGTINGTKHAVTAGMLSQTGLGSWNASQVVDGNTGTSSGEGFYVPSSTTSGEMVVDLGSGNAEAFGKIRSWTSIATCAAVWTIAYSDDGTNWTDTSLTSFAPGASSYDAWFEGTWDHAGSHRYWKMYISSGNGGSQGWQGHEIEWYSYSGTPKETRLHGWAVNY